MSYAGPVSRAKRASAATPNRPVDARDRTKKGRTPARRSPSHADDHRPTLIFAAGIVLGLAVGAAVALMVAPQSGADTRRALGRSSRRAAQRGHDAWDDLRDELLRAARRRRQAFRHRNDPVDDPASLG
ncbi:MAG: YtxH domain-containing protein [Gemmatimonadaceae bacterium]